MFDQRTSEAVHPEPVWRDRADFILAGTLTGELEGKTEQLWARRRAERTFEICCIPFFIYDLALGDIVETDSDYLVTRVVNPSGRCVLRVWFGDSPSAPKQQLVDRLLEFGAQVEWSSPNLLAIDVPDEQNESIVSSYLLERQKEGQLIYETGRS